VREREDDGLRKRRNDEKRRGEKREQRDQRGPFEYGKQEGQCPRRVGGSEE
jgi:hypothetical protein